MKKVIGIWYFLHTIALKAIGTDGISQLLIAYIYFFWILSLHVVIMLFLFYNSEFTCHSCNLFSQNLLIL